MARKSSLSVEALVALGAEKLAQIILDQAQGDAPFRKKVNAALASVKGAEAVAALIDRRLSALERARAMVAWEKEREFAADLAATVDTIVKELAQADARLAVERLLRFIDSHPKVFDRIDDSSGRIQDVYWRAGETLPELIALLSQEDRAHLPKLLTKSLENDTHGFGPRLAAAAAPLLPEPALADWDSVLQKFGDDDCFLGVRQAIAEARGDLDLFLKLEILRPNWRQKPLRAAEKLLAAGRFDEALDWARRKSPNGGRSGGLTLMCAQNLADDLLVGGIDLAQAELEARILEAKGDRQAAQALRWRAFETTLAPEPLRDYLKKLGDFEEDDEIARAFNAAEASAQKYAALHFFIVWPQLERAARLVLTQAAAWDGRHYDVLGAAAAALEEKFPLAASVLYRALLNAILAQGKSQAYGHGARYLAKLETLAGDIADWGGVESHVSFELGLRKKHGRKSGFWSLTTPKSK